MVVGAGPIAEEKIRGLLRAGAKVCVLAPRATDRIQAWHHRGKIRWQARKFREADLSGAFLVIAATSSPGLQERIYRLARGKKVLCNVVDDPVHCDFYYGAVVRRGALQIAISSGGQSPALAQRLRKQLEQQFGSEYQLWIEELGKTRQRLFSRGIAPARRKELLHRLASASSFEEFLRRRKRTSRRV